jgi:hypothetical protein
VVLWWMGTAGRGFKKSFWGSCVIPGDFAGGGTCGGIARGIMWEGERTGSGAAKELRGGFKYPWDRREGL